MLAWLLNVVYTADLNLNLLNLCFLKSLFFSRFQWLQLYILLFLMILFLHLKAL